MPKSSATPQPFPGMDPYLEREWEEVHASLTVYARDALQPQLGGELRAAAERRLIVEDDEVAVRPSRPIVPDTLVVEVSDQEGGVAVAAPPATVTATAPLIVYLTTFERPQTFLKIVDVANGNTVVTVIEFLSPSNKRPGDGKTKYEQKRDECLQAGVNYIEIDLTRAGRRELLVIADKLAPIHRTEYAACVFRAMHRDRLEFYPIPLWAPLPEILVPLRPQDADVRLPLQSLIAQVQTHSRFSLDYSVDCNPPLAPADLETLRGRLEQPLPSAKPQ
ncbi:MAG: DUF4058 family protein [Planctomycetaceae bacterium]